jgi:hypothetical protein
MKPITVPIVVAVKIKRFSARVLLKIKPFWETNRIWFGFYRKPELKLELECEPIISNKLIKIQMVNQVIEKRVKDALEAYVMLPNMDDLSFWDYADVNGSPFDQEDYSELISDVGTFKDRMKSEFVEGEFERDEMLNVAIMGEAMESQLSGTTYKQQYITNYLENVGRHCDAFEVSSPSPQPPPSDLSLAIALSQQESPPTSSQQEALPTSSKETPMDAQSQVSETPSSIVEYLGNAAFSLGQWSRQLGLDRKTQEIVTTVAGYTQPALHFAHEKTAAYRSMVRNQAAVVGLTAIEKLGLKPDPSDSPSGTPRDSITSEPSKLKSKSSTNWSVLGLSISTSAPVMESPPSARSRSSRRGLRGLDSPPSMEKSTSHDSVRTSSNFSRNTSSASLLSDLPIVEQDIEPETDTSEDMEDNVLFVDQSLRLRTRKQVPDGDSTPRSHSRKASYHPMEALI